MTLFHPTRLAARPSGRSALTLIALLALAVALPAHGGAQVLAAEPPIRVTTVGDTLHGAVGGVTVDRLGYVYVADFGEKVWKFTPWGTAEVFATGLYGASGNAIDNLGNLMQSNFLANTVSRIDRDGLVTTLATGLSGPVGIAVMPGDTLVVCNCRGNTLSRVTPDGTVTPFAESPLFKCPNGITRHPDGHFFVANFTGGAVLRVSVTGEVSEYATVPGGGNGHVVWAADDLYVTGLRANRVFRIDADGNVSLVAGTGQLVSTDGNAKQASFATPNGIAYDPVRDALYTNDYLIPWLQRTRVEPLSLLRKLQMPTLTERFNVALAAGGPEAAIAAHRRYKATRTTQFTELEVNALGYGHLQAGRIDAAIAAFTVNAEDYPGSFNAWDSLAEGLAAAGRVKEAIENYRKSLELNPANANAVEMIRKLGGQ